MKKGMFLAFGLAAIAGMLMVGTSDLAAAKEKPIVIKLSHDLNEGTPQDVGAKYFERLVEERTEGKVDVRVFPSGQLGDDVEIAEMLQTSTVQAGLIPTAKLSGFTSTVQLYDLPFLFPNKEIAYSVFDSDLTDEVFAELEKVGMVGISVWESGFKQFTSNIPVREPSDFQGQKIRVMQSPLLIAQYKAVGAVPSVIAFPEVYNALQQGVVDGQENPLVSITNMKFYEVQKSMTLSNHGYLGYAFLFSKATWEKFDAETRGIIKQAAIEAAKVERDETAAQEAGFLKTIADSGTQVIELTEEQRLAFEKAMKPVHAQFADAIGKELLQKTYDMIDSLR